MTDILQITHWLDRAISILKADAGVTAISTPAKIIQKSDLAWYNTSDLIADKMPAILVGPGVVEDDQPQVEADRFRFTQPIRVVMYWQFDVTELAMEVKGDVMGVVHGAFATKVADFTASGWSLPTGTPTWQVFRCWPRPVEFRPPEEAQLRTLVGLNQIFAAALTLELVVDVTL